MKSGNSSSNCIRFHSVEASSPKNFFRISLSIPITRMPLSEKKRTASEPINPEEPVMITVSNLFFYQVLIVDLTDE